MKTHAHEGPDATVRRGRGFWLAYVAGWTLYTALVATAIVAEGESLRQALVVGPAHVLPAALLGVLVAAWRRRLFHPGRSLLHTLAILAATGIAYALAVGLLTEVVIRALAPLMEDAEQWLAQPFLLRSFTGLFLYIILAGFLLWTESIARVQESRAALAREAMLRAQAEAAAVRARFNPHFVFNTLHSLLLLVRAEPDTAERAIEDVAALIRYASRLEREERDQVPLEEEIDFARRYLALEELRLADRLRVEWEVAEGLGRTRVPAFSLQTLLENAVKHGVAPRASGATVRVGVAKRDGGVVLSVEDDGEGASGDGVTGSGGRGLELLGERVRVLYGVEGAMEWRTEPGGGFRVEIRVPAVGTGVGTGSGAEGEDAEGEDAEVGEAGEDAEGGEDVEGSEDSR